LHLAQEIVHALYMAFAMFWEILWALILGFFISGVVQAVVSKRKIAKVLGDDRPRTIATACGLGAASSSCSYAAVAIARALFRKGANFTAAMAFELGSTNLVAELGIIMAILLGWQFTLAEFMGAPLMVAIMAVLFRMFLKREIVERAREQANKGISGVMEGHAEMDMSVTEGPLFRRMLSDKGRTAISHYFVIDWVSIWKDIAGGLLLAGFLAVFVPKEGWQAFFLTSHQKLTTFWSPLVGPVVAVLSFVCSVGNVPLAAVLWNGGSSFGGVLAFIYADLIVLPILNIYRKYYGLRVSVFLFVTMYASMAAAALVIELIFKAVGLVPSERHAKIVETAIQWNYTTYLNIIFLVLTAMLVIRFMRTRGPKMLKMMNKPTKEHQMQHG
jgi:uncharacterized membrane protein YraQ (UPF0718 family)